MHELNRQLPEKMDESAKLQINHIWQTIQGEGPWQGMPAVFIRLAGCNLQCPLCDTEYTLRSEWTSQEVVSIVQHTQNTGTNLIVITGGEPFRQASLIQLVSDLLDRGFHVQIETNGIVYRELPWNSNLLIVISPKTSTASPRWNAWHGATEVCWKYVLHADYISTTDGLPTSALGMRSVPSRPPSGVPLSRIYVQPVDVGDDVENKHHLAAALKSSMNFGYRLNLQIHKLLGVK